MRSRASVSNKFVLFALALVAGALLPLDAQAAERNAIFAELVTDGRLKVSTSIAPQADIVMNQQVELVIEIETDSWFSGGTKIGLFEVEGALVLRRETFATNLTRRTEGGTRTVQRWTILLYPLRPGRFSVPQIAIDLSVAGEDGTPLSGRVTAPPVKFSVLLPAVMTQDSQWVATNALTVTQQFDRELDSLQPGDAVTRTVVIAAQNLPALLLPTLLSALPSTANNQAQAANNPSVEGLSIYVRPPVLDDSNQRGVVSASRTQEIVYLIERPGSYQVSPQTFRWWNVDTQTLEVATLPGFTLLTVGFTRDHSQTLLASLDEGAAISASRRNWLFALVLIGIAFLALALVRFRRAAGQGVFRSTLAGLEKQFLRHCRNNEHSQALAALYKMLDQTEGDTAPPRLRQRLGNLDCVQLTQLAEALFRNEYGRQPDSQQLILSEDLKELRRQLQLAFAPKSQAQGRAKDSLVLNPRLSDL